MGGYFGVITYDINGVQTSLYSILNLNRVAVSADSTHFIASTETNKFLYGSWNNTYTYYTTNYTTCDTDYSADGQFFVLSASNGRVLLYNASNSNLLKEISTGNAGGIYGARLTSDSRYLLAVAAASGQIYLYYRSDYYYLNCT